MDGVPPILTTLNASDAKHLCVTMRSGIKKKTSVRRRDLASSRRSTNSIFAPLRRRLLVVLVGAFLVTDLASCFSVIRGIRNGRLQCSQLRSTVVDGQWNGEKTNSRLQKPPREVLVHWKGEGVEGYSLQFRHLEFLGALAAVTGNSLGTVGKDWTIGFRNALNYTGPVAMPEVKRLRYNQAMQFVECHRPISRQSFAQIAERCSLVHALYEVEAESNCFETLLDEAIKNGAFSDMAAGGENERASWCVRVHQYGEASELSKAKRHGSGTRSMDKEREACLALRPLLIKFGGRVDLRNPVTSIYVFDGLQGANIALTRRLSIGPRISNIAPNTRVCITNTPLCPIAAFTLCNVAGVVKHSRILDPYAGSAAILLAAAMIEPTCQTVAIEIAHDGLVNRDDIRRDFTSRSLTEPVALIHGDSTSCDVRSKAREAVGGKPFDLIITDPPYGIRESTIQTVPIHDLLRSIAADRRAGNPTLRARGKLVCFIPCQNGQLIGDVLPSEESLFEAGLSLETMQEQPLNSKLSRWLVSFVCTSA